MDPIILTIISIFISFGGFLLTYTTTKSTITKDVEARSYERGKTDQKLTTITDQLSSIKSDMKMSNNVLDSHEKRIYQLEVYDKEKHNRLKSLEERLNHENQFKAKIAK